MEIPEDKWHVTRAEVTLSTIAIICLVQQHPRREDVLAAIERSTERAAEQLLAHPTPDESIDELRKHLTAFLAYCRTPE